MATTMLDRRHTKGIISDLRQKLAGPNRDKWFADAASFLRMECVWGKETDLAPVLIRSYALNMLFVSRALLELLKPKLSSVELEYVEVDGPEIVHQHWLHDVYTEPGGCSEGRAARREAKRLEEIAKKKLTDAGVSPERQQLLEDLVFAADARYHHEYPPKKIEHIRYHMSRTFKGGNISRFKEVAGLLDAPGEIREFLNLLHKQASLLVGEF